MRPLALRGGPPEQRAKLAEDLSGFAGGRGDRCREFAWNAFAARAGAQTSGHFSRGESPLTRGPEVASLADGRAARDAAEAALSPSGPNGAGYPGGERVADRIRWRHFQRVPWSGRGYWRSSQPGKMAPRAAIASAVSRAWLRQPSRSPPPGMIGSPSATARSALSPSGPRGPEIRRLLDHHDIGWRCVGAHRHEEWARIR